MTLVEEKIALSETNQNLTEKLSKAINEKEMYINELIKAKTKQAEILDEANKISAAATMKI
jgi:hypothetical protein